jgi:hypothetical protein
MTPGAKMRRNFNNTILGTEIGALLGWKSDLEIPNQNDVSEQRQKLLPTMVILNHFFSKCRHRQYRRIPAAQPDESFPQLSTDDHRHERSILALNEQKLRK